MIETIRNMIGRTSQSPVKANSKRSMSSTNDSRPTKTFKGENHQVNGDPKFSFEEVKTLLELIQQDESKTKQLCTQGLRALDLGDIKIPGHSSEKCRELISGLYRSTRRIRTVGEVNKDILDNLQRKTYTGIIKRVYMDKDNIPKRPVSAYLLYHQDRYEDLKQTTPLAAEVSKIVSEEWKGLSPKKRREYEKRYNDLMRNYEDKMEKLGLVDSVEPKRPGSARNLYISDKMDEFKETNYIEDYSKEQLNDMEKNFGAEFDTLDRNEKEPYVELAKQKLEQYKREQEEFIAMHPHLKPKMVTQVRPRKERKERITKASLPSPPQAPLKFYIEKKMPEGLEGEEAEDLKRNLREKFASLPPKKQLKFIKKAVKDKDRYQQEVEEFVREHPEYSDQLKPKEAALTKEQWRLYQSKVEKRPELPSPNAYLLYCAKLLKEEASEIRSDGESFNPTRRMQHASETWRDLSAEEKVELEREYMDSIERYISEATEWWNSLSIDRKQQLLEKEPRANPEYWAKKLRKSKRAANRKKD